MSVLGLYSGYRVKYTPLPSGVPSGFALGGVGAEQIIHVGDNPEHDIQGARAVGMRTVWMNSQEEMWPGGHRADREIDNLRQLPSAIASISSSD